MEDNKKFKISLTTLIFLMIIVVFLIAVIAYASIKFLAKNALVDDELPEVPMVANETETPRDEEEKEYSIPTSDFSFNFLKMENNKKNMVYSPLSIKYALKMLADGAEGNTKKQIEDAIGNEALTKYDNIEDILSLANSLYIRDTYQENVKDEYMKNLVNKYNSEIKFDSFKSANNINNWIENKTFGQIKNTLSDEVVTNPNTEMVLINALAIDMEWESSFDGADTHGDDFYLENGEEMNATMMKKNGIKNNNISYYQDDDVTSVAMDLKKYEDVQMEFIAIMPNKEKLDNYIENFDKEKLEKISDNFTKTSKTKDGVDIAIPRFSFDYSLKLEEDLKELGIKDSFNSELADFSNISDENLWVGGALHKANIDLSEKGVKAAATTVIYLEDGAMIGEVKKPVNIKIDKPFMYVIRDKKTNEIWFVGAVYEPNSWDNDKASYEYY